MEAVVCGQMLFAQQVGEWIEEFSPDVSLNYISNPRDLESTLELQESPHLFVILTDTVTDRRSLTTLSSITPASLLRLWILCPPTMQEEISACLPAALRSRVGAFGRSFVGSVLTRAGDELALRFDVMLPSPSMHLGKLVGDSPAMHKVYQRIEKVARTNCCCLITGETGTGKEDVARALHQNSRRANGPFVAVNSGAIPGELIESELFGHEKGAFTGAVSRRRGLFETADGGTLLIDEIGELPLNLQPVFLRSLQEGQVTPVGSSNPKAVDVRFIAATNRDLAEEVGAGRFRSDLFYRLEVVPISLPPLRDRAEDIPELIRHAALEFNERHGLEIAGLTGECLAALKAHAWPGNVRQLFNVLERMMVLAEAPVLDEDDLPSSIRQAGTSGPPRVSIDIPDDGLDFYAETERFQRAILEQVLDRVSWNKNRAASLLKMNRTTLVERLKRLGMTPRVDVGAA